MNSYFVLLGVGTFVVGSLLVLIVLEIKKYKDGDN